MHPGTVKKALGLLVQVGVTAALLTLVFHDGRKRAQMAEVCRHADWRWLAAGLAIYGLVELMAVIRWQILLRIQGFRLTWKRATAILFISEFFLTFTPGLVGGDAMRIFYLVKEDPEKKADAVTAVLMDRLMGMATLICLAGIIVGGRHGWLSRTTETARLANLVLLILGGGAALLALAWALTHGESSKRWPVPGFVRDMVDAFRRFSHDRRGTALAFGTTLLSHGCYYASFCCAAQALVHFEEVGTAFADMFSIMPIENTLTALPVSFAGVGLRESLFQTLLRDLADVPAATGALVGSAGFGLKLLWSLPGAVVFLTHRLAGGKRRPAPTASAGNRPPAPA